MPRFLAIIAAIYVALTAPAQSVHPLDGIWRIDGGPTLRFAPLADNTYNVVAVDAPDLRIAPGTVLGTARRSSADSYDIRMSLAARDSHKKGSEMRFDARLDIDAYGNPSLTLVAVRPFKASVWLRYCLLFSASLRSDSKNHSFYAERISPSPAPSPRNPVIL